MLRLVTRLTYADPNIGEFFLFQVTDTGIIHVARNNRCLEMINVSRCQYITDAGIEYLAMHLPHLHHLSLEGCQRITDASLESLTQAGDLRRLNIAHCKSLTLRGISDMEKTSPWINLVDRSGLEH